MKQKKFKILLGVGIAVAVVAICAASVLAWQFQFRWISLPDNTPNELTVSETEGTVTMNIGGWFDVVYLLNEPVFYIASERVVMRDGINLRNGIPYVRMRDVMGFNAHIETAMNTISEACPYDPVGIIVNGLYGQGTDEQNAMIHSLLGNELARQRFELYFQWFNTIHELGHLITVHYGTYDPGDMSLRHMIEEEQLVNSFGVAFWMYFGDREKLYELETVIDYILSNITPPVENMSHLDFMRQAVDENRIHEVFTFEIYGWFQFNIVRDALLMRDTLNLSELLTEMTGTPAAIHPNQTLTYQLLGVDTVSEIVADVAYVLRSFGISVPNTYVAFNTDPNMHMLQYPVPRSLIEPNVNRGSVIQAWR